MTQGLITDIWATPHPANQLVINVERDRYRNGLTFYKDDRPVNRSAAFKLIQNSSRSNHFEIPLRVAARFAVDKPGEYCVVARGCGFELISIRFTLKKGAHSKEIGPFYADVNVDCPFKAMIDDWSIFYCHSRRGKSISDFEMTMYFFLGSTTLPLQEFRTQNVHVQELIKRTIPDYKDIADKNFTEVERKIVKDTVYSLWKLGERDFCYDSAGGASSFLAGGNFQLGRMLMKQARTFNCYDVAALVYAAFKSFGKRRIGGPNGPETDIFDITIHKVEDWGYIYPSTLFGWQGTPNELSNDPFWQLRPGNQISLVDPNDPDRQPFARHCFTLLRNSRFEEKVIDLCHAVPDNDPKADFSDCQHLFQDGWSDLRSYQAHTDRGWRTMQQGDLEDVPLTSMSVQLSSEDIRCREIWSIMNRLSIIPRAPGFTEPGKLKIDGLPHWCFRPEDRDQILALISELKWHGRFPYFGSQP